MRITSHQIYGDTIKTFIAVILIALVLPSARVGACIHVPVSYKSAVNETTKEAVIFHDGTNAHLIIRTGLKSDVGDLPATMAWVLPLPSLPVHYQEEGAGLFEQLFAAFIVQYRGKSISLGPGSKGGIGTDGIKVHEMLQVGSYTVQPIEILSEDAGDALNNWLTGNGFGPVPVENQKFYLHKGAAFLALKLSGLAGGMAQVKPLHIVYPSTRAILPLKFSSHSGEFDVSLYAVTAKPIKRDAFDAFHLHFEGTLDLKTALGNGTLPDLFKALGPVEGYVSKFQGGQFNSKTLASRSVKNLPTDPFILPPKFHEVPWWRRRGR